MLGKRFGRLVISEALHTSKNGHRYYVCLCDCGKGVVKRGDRLRSGEITSCGCAGDHRLRHGHVTGGKRSLMYVRWYSMIARCARPNHRAYKFYGGKGVAVCDRWLQSFANFLADMGEPPLDEQGKAYHIDRIDPAGDYTPANCRWLSGYENRSRAKRKE